MSQAFEGYERQYCELSVNLSRMCSSVTGLHGEKKQQKISKITAGLDDAEALIRKMDLEARSLQQNIKTALLAKLREYKSDLNSLKSKVIKLSSLDSRSTRDDLLESGMADTLMESADQRGRLLMTTEMMKQSSGRIKESRRTMLETVELGVSILEDLHLQRQSLLHSQDTLHGTDDNIEKSKRVLSAMSRRINRNKYIAGSIITTLVLVIIFIVYSNLTH